MGTPAAASRKVVHHSDLRGIELLPVVPACLHQKVQKLLLAQRLMVPPAGLPLLQPSHPHTIDSVVGQRHSPRTRVCLASFLDMWPLHPGHFLSGSSEDLEGAEGEARSEPEATLGY